MQIIDDRNWREGRTVRTDHEWVRLLGWARQGKGTAVDRLANDILEYVQKRVRALGVPYSDAADVAQNCAIEVLRHLEDFDLTRGTFDGWMAGFALNAVRTYNRGAKKLRSEVALEDIPEPCAQETMFSEQRNGLEAALSKLSSQDRRMLGLKFGQGLTSDEVAARLGMRGNQVRNRMSRALERLRQQPAIRELLSS
ncbi:MAG: sigma-70 family RNA polymerase sigma factor [Armatimonadota bacterium]|nr:sigma-70 family RNA polymerase sigma factor [Armatimonadota bacterium]